MQEGVPSTSQSLRPEAKGERSRFKNKEFKSLIDEERSENGEMRNLKTSFYF